MPHAAAQRDFALEIVRKLRGAGFEALWAGGCVRDQLLGLTPKDYDVATNATPNQIRDLFGRRRTLPIGTSFGVITVLGPRAAGQIEVATFRIDAAYSDGRHPDSVTFTDAEHDAQRRDFTINGLFFDPLAEQVVDYVDGRRDLERRVIRAIGEPRHRFEEDKLRMLRAVRFAATFGFTIEPATLAAIQEMASQITAVSAERIGMEIRRMLLDRNRAAALTLLRDTTLLPHVLPEISELPTNRFDDTTRILAALHEPTLATVLAALLSTQPNQDSPAPSPQPRAPSPQPPVPVPHSPAPSPQSPFPIRQPPANLCRRLRYTNKELDRTAWLLTHHAGIAEAQSLPWPRLQRILIHEGAAELLALREAIAGPNDVGLNFCRERLNWPAAKLNPPLLVDGSDLIRHGFEPGPEFADLLENLRDAQLNGEIHTTDEALALADRLRPAN